MKRRNAECGKLRRPLKRSKITEGIYGSTFLYAKFLMVWMLVLMADFILDFRFEYLWPFWLLLRSVYDSFKYQGLAFSVFFVCIALTSDVICYLVIPVQWLFFAASTYVWVQYVWHTERGICLPTVSLWLLCVYIEASVRLQRVKGVGSIYHMDLCRPFAAHCIGYPVVTLGFGFKSYVSYRLRMRKQKEVEKENEFYMQLLQQALPADQQMDKQKSLPSKSQEDEISNGGSLAQLSGSKDNMSSGNVAVTTAASSGASTTATMSFFKRHKPDTSATAAASSGGGGDSKKQDKKTHIDNEISYIEQQSPPGEKHKRHNTVNDFDEETMANEQNAKTFKQANGVGRKVNSAKDSSASAKDKDKKGSASGTSGSTKSNNTPHNYTNNKDEVIVRLESDVKRLKADLQSSRNCEQELRSQINNYIIGDKSMKSELYQLRQDNESLQNKLHNLVTSRQQDKQSISILDRKLTDLRKEKTTLETQLSSERRAKKAEEAAAARAVAMAAAARGECTEACKLQRRERESEMKTICHELKMREDKIRQMEQETQALRQYKEAQNETEVLMSALHAMQDKNAHLENSLSAETRVKLDLFSALGEAKRNLEIQNGMLAAKELEIADLKSKIAEVMALIPSGFHRVSSAGTPTSVPTPHFSENFTMSPQHTSSDDGDDRILVASSLNPNASDFSPS